MDTRRNRPGAMPLQARPVQRDRPETGAPDARTGVTAAMSSCATMTGPARQMCYAQYGVAG
ncbi:hypothetical protein H4W23_22495 [Streptomyces gardneri]|uniref:hypothetical protein n=1 Tax=Streptomyces gardneri TaxID=66892 RepID=UPI0006BE11F1|nr:hypothetical protein [Streptomyces gardneri]QPK47113.1 hypothetical protein H4W23_22495 [Streptomyces gardneri]WRK38531.1 hypothetical protein U0M97_22595 [Streptomyces venezuelae]CUM39473.1 hypothetical protein BN2537_7911 [Streptomyces venezuelae]